MRMCYVQAAAAVRAVFDVDVEDPFEQPGPTQARRRVIACRRGCLLWRTGDDFTTQLCVRREHAMALQELRNDRLKWARLIKERNIQLEQ